MSDKSEYTITGLLMCPEFRGPLSRTIDLHRSAYEAAHGQIDITREYITLREPATQRFLIKEDPKRWGKSIPPHMQDFLSLHWSELPTVLAAPEYKGDPLAAFLLDYQKAVEAEKEKPDKGKGKGRA